MAKNILDMLFWHPHKDISYTKISYIHRGAPGNIKTISGRRVENMEKGFLVLEDETHIPFHRIIKIEHNQKVIWKKTIK